MYIDRLTSTLVSMTLVLSSLLLFRADTAVTRERLLAVYLGRISTNEDPGFAAISQASIHLPAQVRERFELRWLTALLPDRNERVKEAIDEALAMQPQVIIAPNPLVAYMLRQRQLRVPVIFSTFLNPVKREVVTSIQQRDEPFTGVWIADDMDSKRLEILHDAYPAVKTVAVLMDRDWGEDTDAAEKLPALGRRLGLDVSLFYAEELVEAEEVLARPEAARFDAWCLPPTGLTNLYSAEILARIKAWGKPVIVGETRDVQAGAPLSYMVEESFRWTAMTDLMGRVLQGEPAGSIPIQRPVQSVLAVRPTPAAGFPAPSAQVVRRADLVLR